MSDGQVRLSDWTEDRLLSIDLNTDRLVAAQPDLATRVAADIYARVAADSIGKQDDTWGLSPHVLRAAAESAVEAGRAFAVEAGRAFAEAVERAKEPKS